MLVWSAWMLSATALGGLVLIAVSQVAKDYARLRWPGFLHGLAGIAGFVLLAIGLRGPPRGVEQGSGSFGLVAASLMGSALLIGALAFLARLRRRAPSMLAIGVHATLAVGGVVMCVHGEYQAVHILRARRELLMAAVAYYRADPREHSPMHFGDAVVDAGFAAQERDARDWVEMAEREGLYRLPDER